MTLKDVLASARDAVTARHVFAEPYEKDGVTVIAAASVAGGGGGGGGHDEQGHEGEGGGFGLAGRPEGVFVIRGGDVRWQPAVDVNRLVLTAGVVAVVYLITRAIRRRTP